jgi:hypothetical protein
MFVPFETIMMFQCDVIARRQGETMRPWDAIEVRRGEAEAIRERQAWRWTNPELETLRRMVPLASSPRKSP